MAASKVAMAADEVLSIRTVELKAEQYRWAIRVRADVPMRQGYGRDLALSMRAQIAALPEKRYLRLHATWRDGAREALYTWLRIHRFNRLAGWASARWPVRWATHDAMLLFPAVSLPDDLQHGMTLKIPVLDEQLPVFTGHRDTV